MGQYHHRAKSTLAFIISACKETHMQNETSPRSQQFAKLLTYQGKQALAFLQRTSDDDLNVVVQLWSDDADHQIRALIATEHDDQAQVAFDSLDDQSLAQFIEASGLAGLL
jgi:hypothetical protein